MSYHELIKYMKELNTLFGSKYDNYFILGNIYQGSPEYSYFSLTTNELRKKKLKFVIVLNHQKLIFSICLSAQNKSIRKECWEMFKGSDWNKYHLAASIQNSLSIIDHIIIEHPDFNDKTQLTAWIETESMKFINDLQELLDSN